MITTKTMKKEIKTIMDVEYSILEIPKRPQEKDEQEVAQEIFTFLAKHISYRTYQEFQKIWKRESGFLITKKKKLRKKMTEFIAMYSYEDENDHEMVELLTVLIEAENEKAAEKLARTIVPVVGAEMLPYDLNDGSIPFEDLIEIKIVPLAKHLKALSNSWNSMVKAQEKYLKENEEESEED